MWITTYHRFPTRGTFVEACIAAGWQISAGVPDLPHGVALDILGPLIGPSTISAEGCPVPGNVLDSRYHVNLAWHAQEMDPVFAASQILPDILSRGWDLASQSPPGPPPVPASVPAWKGKAALREAGLLEAVEAAVAAAGGRAQDAWTGASEWGRGSEFLGDLAAALGLSAEQVDQMLREADAIHG